MKIGTFVRNVFVWGSVSFFLLASVVLGCFLYLNPMSDAARLRSYGIRVDTSDTEGGFFEFRKEEISFVILKENPDMKLSNQDKEEIEQILANTSSIGDLTINDSWIKNRPNHRLGPILARFLPDIEVSCGLHHQLMHQLPNLEYLIVSGQNNCEFTFDFQKIHRQIDTLYVSDMRIANISKDEKFTPSTLVIDDCEIMDSGAIQNISKITSLTVNNSKFKHPDVLKSFSNLSELSVYCCNISNLKWVSGLVNLSSFSFECSDEDQTISLVPLMNCKNLNDILITNGSDFEVILSLPKLSEVYLSSTKRVHLDDAFVEILLQSKSLRRVDFEEDKYEISQENFDRLLQKEGLELIGLKVVSKR